MGFTEKSNFWEQFTKKQRIRSKLAKKRGLGSLDLRGTGEGEGLAKKRNGFFRGGLIPQGTL